MSGFGNCELVPLADRPAGRAREYLRCSTCGEVVPIEKITDLRPGVCPGQRRADAQAFECAGAYNGLYDWCEQQSWELLLTLGPARPDLVEGDFPPHDLVIEIHGHAAGLPAAIRVPHEGDLDRYAAGVLRGLLERDT